MFDKNSLVCAENDYSAQTEREISVIAGTVLIVREKPDENRMILVQAVQGEAQRGLVPLAALRPYNLSQDLLLILLLLHGNCNLWLIFGKFGLGMDENSQIQELKRTINCAQIQEEQPHPAGPQVSPRSLNLVSEAGGRTGLLFFQPFSFFPFFFFFFQLQSEARKPSWKSTGYPPCL